MLLYRGSRRCAATSCTLVHWYNWLRPEKKEKRACQNAAQRGEPAECISVCYKGVRLLKVAGTEILKYLTEGTKNI